MLVKYLLSTARPQQWIKNLFVFAALIFGQEYLYPEKIILASLGFIIFCALSSCVYFLNDILDIEQDKAHPLKKNRPIAAGKLSISTAITTFLLLAVLSLAGAWILNFRFFLISLAYFILNLLYSLHLKHVVIVDVLLIAIGFVLRAVAGACAISVPISPWLYLCTILISLFLALAKRRHEIVLLENSANNHRAILSEYSPYFLDQMIAVVTASTLMAYALYTMSPDVVDKFHTKNLNLTIPFVIYGIFRYLYLVHQKEKGGSPSEVMLTDKPLMVNILLWLLACIIILHTAKVV